MVNIDCPICKRNTPPQHQEKHHLIPRKTRKSKKEEKILVVCCSCGDMLHKLFTNKELGKQYNTLEAIIANLDVQNWVSWVQKKPYDFTICTATKKKKRR